MKKKVKKRRSWKNLIFSYRISSNKGPASNKRRTFRYPHWNKCLPLISVSFLFWKKKDKVLTFDIFHFPNFEISASL